MREAHADASRVRLGRQQGLRRGRAPRRDSRARGHRVAPAELVAARSVCPAVAACAPLRRAAAGTASPKWRCATATSARAARFRIAVRARRRGPRRALGTRARRGGGRRGGRGAQGRRARQAGAGRAQQRRRGLRADDLAAAQHLAAANAAHPVVNREDEAWRAHPSRLMSLTGTDCAWAAARSPRRRHRDRGDTTASSASHVETASGVPTPHSIIRPSRNSTLPPPCHSTRCSTTSSASGSQSMRWR